MAPSRVFYFNTGKRTKNMKPVYKHRFIPGKYQTANGTRVYLKNGQFTTNNVENKLSSGSWYINGRGNLVPAHSI
jgi:hydroxymethylpyrimidine pyrophosphatase-like HAD family hydrolase